ncbi:hypothetical protein JOF53_000285 [Crossiella equi]|uniref:Suppressor of fused-like domain-containing protein n=1 Tax=Crossiella equi TaxID=130796 RepID=A0ABS5A4B3_9PSEU|nr:suppressor of fused domain protein [Crossiella equi]MBP2471413.1 hypothetical protein [Crossiella equi]
MTDSAAPGRDAIDAALALLYPGVPAQRRCFERGDGLEACLAYPAPGHWHYIGYGLSELYHAGPEEDPDWSGWGFELTLRVRRGAEAVAPDWPFRVVQHIATHVNTRLVLLEPGHRLDLRRPATGYPALPDAPDTGLTAYVLALDPELGELPTPNGAVRFLQAVGITAAEVADGAATVLARLALADPLLVTDPARAAPG